MGLGFRVFGFRVLGFRVMPGICAIKTAIIVWTLKVGKRNGPKTLQMVRQAIILQSLGIQVIELRSSDTRFRTLTITNKIRLAVAGCKKLQPSYQKHNLPMKEISFKFPTWKVRGT